MLCLPEVYIVLFTKLSRSLVRSYKLNVSFILVIAWLATVFRLSSPSNVFKKSITSGMGQSRVLLQCNTHPTYIAIALSIMHAHAVFRDALMWQLGFTTRLYQQVMSTHIGHVIYTVTDTWFRNLVL